MRKLLSAASSNKTDYVIHNHILVPEDLKAGDIIRCRISTRSEDGSRKMKFTRNALVLGFQFCPVSLQYTAVHVARFSYRAELRTDEDHRYEIGEDDYRRGHINGLSLPVTLRTNHLDLVPLDIAHIPNQRIERIGSVSDQYLAKLLGVFRQRGTLERSEMLSCHAGFDPKQYYVPSHDFLLGESTQGKVEPLIPYTKIDDYDLARIAVELSHEDRHMDGSEISQSYIDELNWRRKVSRPKKTPKLSKLFPKKPKEEPSIFVQGIASQNVQLEAPQIESERISPEARHIVVVTSVDYDGEKQLSEIFQDRSQSRITLPEHLWQGRYLMLKVSDLGARAAGEKEEDMAYRPCALWKLYRDAATGEISGMELHPVTREQASQFSYKMPVYPLKTTSRQPSFLVADCLLRVPLSAQYFHDNATPNFFELPPYKVASFIDEIRKAKKYAEDIRIIGLQDVPDGWVEADLMPPPNMAQLREWAADRRLRFDGNLGDQMRKSGSGFRRHTLG